MARKTPSEKLDKTISEILAHARPPFADVELEAYTDGKRIPYVPSLIRGLRELPSAKFKARLKSELERRAIMASPAAGAVPKPAAVATPYLSIKGAAAAIDFYKKAFGAQEVMRLGQPDGRIGHAEITIAGARIMLADEFPDIGFRGPESYGGSPVQISLEVVDVDSFARQAVAAGATIVRPVEDRFYGERSGHLRDPFGYTWIVSTRTEELTLEEIRRRSLEFVNQMPKPAKFAREGFDTVTPYMIAADGAALIEFAKQAFDAEETFRSIGSAGGIHGEVRIGDSMIMMGGGIPGREFRAEPRPQALHVYVRDTDAAYEKALQAGATSMGAPQDHDYGERGAGVKDAFGNYWYIATHKGENFVPKGMHNVNVYMHPLRGEPVINFLKRAFGAEEITKHASPDGVIHHAEVRVGTSVVEMGEAHGAYQPMPANFFLYVPDADAAHAQAVAAGATSTQAPANQSYGDRVSGVKDPFGNQWWIATFLGETKSPEKSS